MPSSNAPPVYTVNCKRIYGASMTLKGRNALVTGAGRRLGRAFAEGLAAEGVNLIVHYGLSTVGAAEVVRTAESHGVQAVPLQADLNEPASVTSLFEEGVKALGGLDILINNAAIFEPVDLAHTTLDVWNRHISINLTAPFLLSQAFVKQGIKGDIINLLDWRALRPGADHFAYTIAKAGLAAMTRSVAIDAAPDVRVIGLALGAILPPPGSDSHDDSIIQDVPAARWGSPEEAWDALKMLLISPGYITGEILHLDGGRHLV